MKNNTEHIALFVDRMEHPGDVWEVTFDLVDHGLDFEAGQYVWVTLPGLIFDDPRGARRAMSVVSTPSDPPTTQVSIVFRASESGFKKTLLAAEEGMEVLLYGPAGSQFVFPEDKKMSVCMVAGGVGIAPFLSLLRHEVQEQSDRPLHLVYGVRSKDDAAFLEEIKALEEQLTHFSAHVIEGHLSVDDVYSDEAQSDTCEWMLSGPIQMVEAVAGALISKNVDKKRIRTEESSPIVLHQPDEIVRSPKEVMSFDSLRTAIESSSNHMIFTDVDGVVLYANSAAEKLTGFSYEEMQGQTPRLWGGLLEPEVYENMWHTIKTKREPFIGKIKNRRKSGEEYTVLARISPLVTKDGDLGGFLGTEEDITDIERLNQAKDEFLSIATHELRTPLTAIRSNALLVSNGDVGAVSEDVKEVVGDIETAATRLVNLVNDMLDVSRIEVGRMKFRLQDVDMQDVCRQVMDELRELADDRDLELVSTLEGVPSVLADPDKIAQVLTNLVGNAIKFTEEGSVTVGYQEKGDVVTVSVADTGMGMKKEDVRRLFQKFSQLDRQGSSGQKGTGLGLYITLRIIKKLGGKAWAESAGMGKGSTFFFSLPKAGSSLAQEVKDLIEEEAKEVPDQK